MALSQKERDQRSADKKKEMKAETLRMTTHPGTRIDIELLRQRFAFTTNDEMFSTLIRNLVAMPKELAAPAFEIVIHDLKLAEKWRKKVDAATRKSAAEAARKTPDELEEEADAAANQ